MLTAVMAVYAGSWLETKMRVDDAVGAVAVHGVCGFLGMLWVGIFAAGYPTGINNVESSIGGQLMGMMTFLPLGFLSGWVASWILKKLNVLRVPAAVEVAGLDIVEYGTLVYPEMGVIKEQIVEPDGTLVETAAVLELELSNGRARRVRAAEEVDAQPRDLARHHARRRRRVRAVGRAHRAPAQPQGGRPCPRSLTARRLHHAASPAPSRPTTRPTSSSRPRTRTARAS